MSKRIVFWIGFACLFGTASIGEQILDGSNHSIPLPKLDSFLQVLDQYPNQDSAYCNTSLHLISYLRTKDTELALDYAQ